MKAEKGTKWAHETIMSQLEPNYFMKKPSPPKVVKVKAWITVPSSNIKDWNIESLIYSEQSEANFQRREDEIVLPCVITYQPIRTSKRK